MTKLSDAQKAEAKALKELEAAEEALADAHRRGDELLLEREEFLSGIPALVEARDKKAEAFSTARGKRIAVEAEEQADG